MTARVLVAGIGNIFRNDDGFGSAAVARLGTLLPTLPDGVRLVDYGIRGMHLAYDLLDPWDALVLLDAVPDRGEPGRLVVLEIGEEHVPVGAAVDAHGMDPGTVLATLSSLGGHLPARTVLVGCQVADIEDGMVLSPPIAAAVDVAARTVQALLTRLVATGSSVGQEVG